VRSLFFVSALCLGFAVGCATTADPPAPAGHGDRHQAARHAQKMIGTPYRYGGSTPSGFDCSGLVVYSYARAGVPDLPHSVRMLEKHARAIGLDNLRPGDLLFFHLDGAKASHVAIVVDDDSFVHAPSSGKRVEKVSFNHVYWGPRMRRAGRIDR
jgi:cell wall-associated NlpC family hydrolase